MTLGQKLGPIDDPRRHLHVPIRLQACAICGRSHANACNVRVQCYGVMYYITMSRAYATADSVRNQENAQNSPDPFRSQRVGSGDETRLQRAAAAQQRRLDMITCTQKWAVALNTKVLYILKSMI